MKRIWLMLLMAFSVYALAACSDDENNDEGTGDGETTSVEWTLPTEITAGAEITIEGKGFDTASKLKIAGSDGAKMDVDDAVFSATGVTFTLPPLAAGEYTLYVMLNDKEVVSGSIKVNAMKERTVCLTFTYDDWAPEVWNLRYNSMNQLYKIDGIDYEEEKFQIDLAYEDNLIKVTGDDLEDGSAECSYRLENGKVTYIDIVEEEGGDDYGEEMYLDTKADEEEPDYHSFVYNATGHLTYGYGWKYIFTNNNLTQITDWYDSDYGGFDFSNPTYQNNYYDLDLVSCMYFFTRATLYYHVDFLPHLLGICGTISKDLPTSMAGQEVVYEKNGEKISKITWTDEYDGVCTLTITEE